MKKVKEVRRKYFSEEFKLGVLLEYYSSDISKSRLCKKYGTYAGSLLGWIRLYESKVVSLPANLSELEKRVYMSYKKNVSRISSAPAAKKS